MAHSILSPSSAHAWSVCSAYLWANRGRAESSSRFAEEGTLAHNIADLCLRKGYETVPRHIIDELGLPDDMPDYVDLYVATVRAMTENAEYTQSEVGVDLSTVLGVPDQMGTSDYIAVRGSTLQVHDLKYGKGVVVEAEDNWQMALYALGALQVAELCGFGIETVCMVIHQVRLNSVTEWTITRSDLLAIGEELKKSATRAMAVLSAGDPQPSDFCPGEKQCRFCRAKADCRAYEKYATGIYSEDFEPEQSTDLDRFAEILPRLDAMTDWVKAVWARAFQLACNGDEIPGWKLVLGRAGARQWTSDEQAEELLKSMKLKADEMYTKKIISPTAAEKLLKATPKKWTKAEALIVRPEPKPALAPVSDKRPAIAAPAGAAINDFEVTE